METGLDAISLTQKLLSLNTINPPGLERDCAEYLGKLLEAGGFQAVIMNLVWRGRTLLRVCKPEKINFPYVSPGT